MSSASFFWSRVSAAVGRLTQNLTSRYATTWIMLLADDYHVEVGGAHFRPEVLGCPLSWNNKTSGGTVTNWVGLTERRAAWVVKLARETAAARVIQALELLRPFLAPLYAFATSGPQDSVRPVPAYVAFFLRFLAGAAELERHSQCAAILHQEEQASRRCTSLRRAGWRGRVAPVVRPDGRPDPGHSYWFSEEVTPEVFPWVFKK